MQFDGAFFIPLFIPLMYIISYMRLKALMALSIIILIIAVGAVSAEDNLTDELSQGDDGDVLDTAVSGKTFTDIQKTVSSSGDGGTVELGKITYTGSGSPITVSKSITIDGHGATLDAGKKSSIMKVTSKKLTLKNIKFANAKGVALTSKNTELIIMNCTFTNGGGKLSYDKHEMLYRADCDYAGISANGGKLTLTDSTFTSNTNANRALAVYMKNGQLDAKNTVFSKHKLNYDEMASAPDLIRLENSRSSFDGCTFKDNTVPALYTEAYSIIKDSSFSNNYGEITFFGNTNGKISKNTVFDVINSEFTGTTHHAFIMMWAVRLNIEGCTFTANEESIIDSLSEVNINNSIFTGNSAKNGAVIATLGKVTIMNSQFIDNTAEKGSIIYNNEYVGCGEKIDKYLTIINSTITDSYASVQGGAIYATCTNINLQNTNITTKKNSKGSQIYLKASTFKSTNSKHQTPKTEKFTFKVMYSNIRKTTYDSRKRFEVTISEKTEDGYGAVGHVKAIFKVYTGKKYKLYYYNANNEKRADAYFRITSDLSVGKHKIVVMPNSKYSTFPKKTFTLTVKKAKTIVKAKKMTAKYKKSKYFKITVKNKASGKIVPKLKIKVKVFTGKKYKVYTLKTDKKGVAKLNTKKLKRGVHKVEIISKSKNYDVLKKSSIKIK